MNSIDEFMKELDKKPETFKEKLSDLWFDTKFWFEKLIRDPIRGIRNYTRNLIRYSGILWRDKDWDFDFLLNLVDRKLEFMENYHKKSGICVENPWISERIRMTRKLLSVAREEDSDSHHEELFWTPYVNVKNATRYFNDLELRRKVFGTSEGEKMLKFELRLRKAWVLYHKALEQYTHSWWD